MSLPSTQRIRTWWREVPPERSGSAELNGEVLANQIGGQIFSDCWGLACPGNPEKAAALAERMASLTHDQEGLQGARFIAAAIAAALMRSLWRRFWIRLLRSFHLKALMLPWPGMCEASRKPTGRTGAFALTT